jgi:hypothetical protein
MMCPAFSPGDAPALRGRARNAMAKADRIALMSRSARAKQNNQLNSEPTPKSTLIVGDPRSLSILVVEDDPNTRRAPEMFL